jgi:predicted methyltransferase|tara:strand:- start:994 stop:1779 length:786 start_codon:yes stop_codon:yes gene_type:complete
MKFFISVFLMLSSIASSQSIDDILKGKHRSEKNKARDIYRNPKETLNFFGIKNDMTVVELSPGGGWYQEIIGPYLRKNGKYISATYDPESKNERTRDRYSKERDKLNSQKKLYGDVLMVPINAAVYGEENSADLVVSFRNYHNWSGNSEFEKLRAIYKTLKPGGVLGITDHRSNSTKDEKGYACEPCLIDDAEAVGFKYIGSSQINANPMDTKDYPGGVWNLPPTLSENGLKKTQIKKMQKKFLSIGESDRFTIKFIKPSE